MESNLVQKIVSAKDILQSSKLIFWDFDGVIKDSVASKTNAYRDLFLAFGSEVAARVVEHHEQNGGVSRFEKIPLYLKWAGVDITTGVVEDYCNKFSKAVTQAVIDAPWVPGVEEYLLNNFNRKKFILVTATPQSEIEIILHALNIHQCFAGVHGAPLKKSSIIKEELSNGCHTLKNALLIGDSETDMQAAIDNSIPFLLRRTSLNLSIQFGYEGPQFDCFKDE